MLCDSSLNCTVNAHSQGVNMGDTSYSDNSDSFSYSYNPGAQGTMHHAVSLYMIFVFGLIANIAVLLVVGLTRELRTSTNIYIVLLCVLNVTMLLTYTPLKLTHVNLTTSTLVLANGYQFLIKLFSTTSILALVVLSFGRWRAVVKPMWKGAQTKKSNTVQLILVLLVAVVITLPWAFAYEDTTGEVAQNTSSLSNLKLRVDYTKFAIFYGVVVLYLIPLLLIGGFYVSMARKLCSQSDRTIRESIRRHLRARALRNRVAWVVLALVCSFSICYLPNTLSFAMYACGMNNSLMYFLLDWQIHAMLFNTCTDPVCVFLLGSRFRTHLIRGLHIGGIFGYTAKRNVFRNTFKRTMTMSSQRNSSSLALKLQPTAPNKDDDHENIRSS